MTLVARILVAGAKISNGCMSRSQRGEGLDPRGVKGQTKGKEEVQENLGATGPAGLLPSVAPVVATL